MIRKNGFSLFEAALVMLIAAIFIAVMASVFPHKPKPKAQAEAHGRFECYYKNNTLTQRTVIDGSTGAETTVTTTDTSGNKYCEFTPNKFIKYIIIDAVGGGSGGSTASSLSQMGGSAGVFSSSFFASPLQKYRLYPGLGGAKDVNTTASNGGETIVTGYDDSKNEYVEIMKLPGGTFGGSLAGKTTDDIAGCRMIKVTPLDYYNCGSSPTCSIENGYLKVSFCRRKDLYRTMMIPFKPTTSNASDIKFAVGATTKDDGCTEPVEGTTNRFNYHDVSMWRDWKNSTLFNYGNPAPCPTDTNLNDPVKTSLYTMEIVMKTSPTISDAGEDSDLTTFMKAMNYSGGIGDQKPGNGGAKNNDGKAGGVVILW